MYVHQFVPSAGESQKSGLDPLELDSMIVVDHHMGTRNQNQVLYRSNKCS